jgi:hypothetical protein
MTLIVAARFTCSATDTDSHWRVELLDEPGRLPGLICFHKRTRKATRLDQVAQWLPEGRWAAGRWRPAPPIVPKWLIARVEAALRQAQR